MGREQSSIGGARRVSGAAKLIIGAFVAAALVLLTLWNPSVAAAQGPCDATVMNSSELNSAIGCHNAGMEPTTITIGQDFSTSFIPSITGGSALTIAGGGHTITGPGPVNGNDLFSVDGSGPVTFSEVRLVNADRLAIFVTDQVSSVVVENTRIENSGFGISISGNGALLIVENSTITGSRDLALAIGSDSRAEVARSTLSDSNQVSGTQAVFVAGELTMENSTLSGTANGAAGIGVLSGGIVEVSHSTITGTAGAATTRSGASSVTVTSSIVTDSTGVDCGGTIPTWEAASANNFTDDAGCAGSTVLASGSLAPLADNGCIASGSPFACTFTHELVAGSNAVGGGDCASLPNTADQRGFVQPSSSCDAGSYQTGAVDCGLVPFVVTTAAELDTAIACHNARSQASTITLDSDVAVTSTSVITQPDATAKLTIDGNGHTISDTGGDDIFSVEGTGPVEFVNLTLSDAGEDAISITAATTVDIINVTIQNSDYGVFAFDTDAVVRIEHSTISGTQNKGVLVRDGSVLVTNSTVSDSGREGIDVDDGSVVVSNSTVSDSDREGIQVDGGSVVVSNSTISDSGGFGIDVNGSGSAQVVSSVITRSGNPDCDGVWAAGSTNNFTDDGCNGSTTLSGPALEPLADNGCAPTTPGDCPQTHAVLAGSNVIGAGDCTQVPVGLDATGAVVFGDLTEDQRGVDRFDPCTAGAFEAHPCTQTVSTEAELAAAIACHNARSEASTITLGSDVAVTSTSVITQPDLAAKLMIDGASLEITYTGTSDIFRVEGTGPVEFVNITLSDAGDEAIQITAAATVDIINVTIQNSDYGVFTNSTDAVVRIEHSTISGTRERGVLVEDGSVLVTNSTVSDSGTDGINAISGSVVVSNSTISNSGDDGIRVGNGGSVVVSNSTISDSDDDGVIVDGGSVVVSNSTISDSGLVGISVHNGGSAQVVSSVITRSADPDCDGAWAAGSGNNFTDDGCNGSTILSGPDLGPLADNGCALTTPDGCPQTHAVLAGSNVIGAGVCTQVPVELDTTGAVVLGDLTEDQTSVHRFDPCTAGAFEACTQTVSTEAELAAAIACHNDRSEASTITLGSDVAVTSTLTITQSDATAKLTIDGASLEITYTGTSDIFRVEGTGPIEFVNITLSDAGDEAIQITAAATVDIINVTIQNSDYGVFTNSTDAVVRIEHSTVSGTRERGVLVEDGSVLVTNSTVSDSGTDGINAISGSVVVSNSTISNSGDDGIRVGNGGSVVVSNSTISDSDDDGVIVDGGSVVVSNSTISDSGLVGISVHNGGSVEVVSTVITRSADPDCDGAWAAGSGNNFTDDGCNGSTTLSGPALEPLADNGCALTTPGDCPQTHAVLAGSNAIGAGVCTQVPVELDTAGAVMLGDLTEDQTGVDRLDPCTAGAYETYPLGDVNCDGEVTVVDALFVAQFAVGLLADSGQCPTPLNELTASNGDVNSSGTTDIIDALLIAQCAANIPNILCAPEGS